MSGEAHQNSDASGTPLKLSIAICTYNRMRYLPKALDSLLKSGFDPVEHEVIIVDGDAGDGTREYVKELTRSNPAVHYIHQLSKGLPKARNLALEHARGEYVGFLDDDAVACPDWIRQALDIIQHFRPICFGGPFHAMYDTPKPSWYINEYGSVTYGAEPRWLAQDEFLCGGNIFFRREAVVAAGGFDPEFVNEGERFAYGEEAVPQIRIRNAYPEDRFYSDPKLSIRHLVTPQRMKVSWCLRRSYELGRGYAKLVWAEGRGGAPFAFLWRSAFHLLLFIGDVLQACVWRDRSRYPYVQNSLVEKAGARLREVGVFLELYCLARKARK